NISISSSDNFLDASKTITIKSALVNDSLDFSTPIFSTISSVSPNNYTIHYKYTIFLNSLIENN
ncbi:hypothetical protein ACTPEM_23380, partial [Clostridioides difficile]